jgi:hypothetical protein
VSLQAFGEEFSFDVLAGQVDRSIAQAGTVQEVNESRVAKTQHTAHLGEKLVRASGVGGCIRRQEDNVHDSAFCDVHGQVHISERPRKRWAYDAETADLLADHATFHDL